MTEWQTISTDFSTTLLKTSVTSFIYLLANVIDRLKHLNDDNQIYIVFVSISVVWFIVSIGIGYYKVATDSKRVPLPEDEVLDENLTVCSDRLMLLQSFSAGMAFIFVVGLPCAGDKWIGMLTFGLLPQTESPMAFENPYDDDASTWKDASSTNRGLSHPRPGDNDDPGDSNNRQANASPQSSNCNFAPFVECHCDEGEENGVGHDADNDD